MRRTTSFACITLCVHAFPAPSQEPGRGAFAATPYAFVFREDTANPTNGGSRIWRQPAGHSPAAGENLPYEQADIHPKGHAIECRIYAEEPPNNFLPSIGKVKVCNFPQMPGVRVDAGIHAGSDVTPYYDPMLAKIISWGANRGEALSKMRVALQETIILGVQTNIPYLLTILEHPEFVAGNTPTNFLEKHLPAWQPPTDFTDDLLLAIAGTEMWGQKGITGQDIGDGEMPAIPDAWQLTPNWRNL